MRKLSLAMLVLLILALAALQAAALRLQPAARPIQVPTESPFPFP